MYDWKITWHASGQRGGLAVYCDLWRLEICWHALSARVWPHQHDHNNGRSSITRMRIHYSDPSKLLCPYLINLGCEPQHLRRFSLRGTFAIMVYWHTSSCNLGCILKARLCRAFLGFINALFIHALTAVACITFLWASWLALSYGVREQSNNDVAGFTYGWLQMPMEHIYTWYRIPVLSFMAGHHILLIDFHFIYRIRRLNIRLSIGVGQ